MNETKTNASQTPKPAASEAGKIPESAQLQREGMAARDLVVPTVLSEIIGRNLVSPWGARMYMSSVYPDAKRPRDGIEQALFDQFFIAHQRLAKLQARADKAESLEAVEILNRSATILMAELRKLALAIQQYKTPGVSRPINVVHQQNVVSGGDQQVTYVDQSVPDEAKISMAARSKQEGNVSPKINGGRIFNQPQEPETGGCRTDQRPQASAVVA